MNGILGLAAAIRVGIKNSKVVESQAQRGRICTSQQKLDTKI